MQAIYILRTTLGRDGMNSEVGVRALLPRNRCSNFVRLRSYTCTTYVKLTTAKGSTPKASVLDGGRFEA